MSNPNMLNKILVLGGFSAAKKTTINSLLQRKQFVEVVFDGDWAHEAIYPETDVGANWQSIKMGLYMGSCVEALYRKFHSVALSASLGDPMWKAFAQTISGPMVKVALVYDPAEFAHRWLFDPETGKEAPWRAESPAFNQIKSFSAEEWERWKLWYVNHGFAMLDVTKYLTLKELEEVVDQIIALCRFEKKKVVIPKTEEEPKIPQVNDIVIPVGTGKSVGNKPTEKEVS